jgi:hypothetical protein
MAGALVNDFPTELWTPGASAKLIERQYSFNWKQLSAIAEITSLQFYLRLFPGTIRGPQIVEFLKAFGQQIRSKLLIIWDGLPAPRSRLVRQHIESVDGRIALEQLPPYAPELNAAEYTWAHTKGCELGNLRARTAVRAGQLVRTQPTQIDAAPPAAHQRVLEVARTADVMSRK